MKHERSVIHFAAVLILLVSAVLFFVKSEYILATQSPVNSILQQLSDQTNSLDLREIVNLTDPKNESKYEEFRPALPTLLYIPSIYISAQESVDLPLTQPETILYDLVEFTTVPDFPSLEQFISEVRDGQAGLIRGVYVSGLLALPVIQQPNGDAAFVSDEDGILTEFQNATKHGVIGIMAHNHLSGRLFYELNVGDEIVIIYGDSQLRSFQVTNLNTYQRLERNNIRSDFIDQSNGDKLTSSQVFQRYYRGQERVTLQTCLENDDVLNWGLIFIEAMPETEDQNEPLG